MPNWKDDTHVGAPEIFHTWMRDLFMPAVRAGTAQSCFLKHQRCSDEPSGRCAMIALTWFEGESPYTRDARLWMTEIRKAEEAHRAP